MSGTTKFLCILPLLLAVLLGAAASNGRAQMQQALTPALETVLRQPPAGLLAGELRQEFEPANLHEYLDGGAERYLGYGFQRLAVRELRAGADGPPLRVEVYRMDRPANAYGLFSSDRAGEDPGGSGMDAALGEHLLQFWQGPYFFRIQDYDLAGGLRETILALGRALAAAAPPSGPRDRPRLLGLLPAGARIEDSVIYFHTRNSLNSLIYLGEEDRLSLSGRTAAVSAEYDFRPGGGAVARLVVIHYPEEQACAAAAQRFLAAREKLPREAIPTLVERRGSLLALMFGQADPSWLESFKSVLAAALAAGRFDAQPR